ncbi:hypothetical protein HS088_TW13G01307 [Tripterygium wilfordii]|uniref:Cation-transporting ATPase n=1 Tax=Tripterygium wilfordii TaxID=458696 RepID=A0A7J7CWM6_TRIWF|nr:uncharacterized protein LOC120012772 [Tripterygium wilfordii]KAF5738408.1 hypothetical protein HS088_TW13G01307 [Tripterygium wilfordii]
MESKPDSSSVSGQLLTALLSEKVIGGKRNIHESGYKEEPIRKRVKMRDLESVFRSEGISTHCSQTDKLSCDELQSGEEMSQVTNVPVTLDFEASQVERSGRGTFPVVVDPVTRPLNLNTEVSLAKNSVCDVNLKFPEKFDKLSLLTKQENEHDITSIASGGVGLDLNAEDVSSSECQETSYGDSKSDQLKSVDVPECGSTTGSQEEKDSLRIWKEMKQNGFLSSSHGGLVAQSGFLSSSHGGIPVPKQRGRKSKTDAVKKRLELAKKEQSDRFAKMAAPSGLLNELNPGIINHVRNRKQVHSIIEALVRSEKLENGHIGRKQASYLAGGAKETSNRKEKETSNDSGIHGMRLSTGDGKLATLSVGQQTIGYPTSSGDGNSSMVGRALDRNCISNSNTVRDDDMFALKSSTSMKASEDAISMFNEESTNISSVSSLSVKAATVTSQWLELMHQDLKGRLSALRRSKKRVRAVITTELPFLLSKEFSSNQENGPFILKGSFDGLSSDAISAMHQARWNTLFDQMDKTLSEEEIQLESWLNQVKEMQLLCEQGLQHMHWNIGFDSQPPGTSESDSRPMKVDCSGRELSVRAAAASIYSTCNFLMSRENLPCF